MDDNFVAVMTVGAVLVAGYIYYNKRHADLVYCRSGLDGEEYLVRNLPDKEGAADMLARVKQNMIVMVNHLAKNYGDRECVQLLRSRFDPNKIMETSAGEKYTSYTINKGEKMVLCIRARDGTNRLEKENTITFVTLHEMAHVMTKSIGHEDEEFWMNFKFLLTNAEELGMYQSVDYSATPEDYCGMQITDNPLTDDSIKLPA